MGMDFTPRETKTSKLAQMTFLEPEIERKQHRDISLWGMDTLMAVLFMWIITVLSILRCTPKQNLFLYFILALETFLSLGTP